MREGWLERSLASLQTEMRDWPEWKREAANLDPHLALSSESAAKSHEATPETCDPEKSGEKVGV